MDDKSPKPMNVRDAVVEKGISATVILQALILAALIGGGKLGIDGIQHMDNSIQEQTIIIAGIATNQKIIDIQVTLNKKQIEANTKHLSSRDNIRWNKPDQELWSQRAEKLNKRWKAPPSEHRVIK